MLITLNAKKKIESFMKYATDQQLVRPLSKFRLFSSNSTITHFYAFSNELILRSSIMRIIEISVLLSFFQKKKELYHFSYHSDNFIIIANRMR